uniref:Protein SEC13 homolog n=1 Tax=Strongyloides papillosus TaxID=174720 RepID=A0A0N5B1W5_STREA
MVPALARIDAAHRDIIHDVQMNEYGNRLATCSADRMVKIFDVKANNQTYPMAELSGHEGPVWKVAWAPLSEDFLLASCSYDKKVIIWKETNSKWQKMFEYSQHEASVNSIDWAPKQHGLILVCGSTDGRVSIIEQVNDEWKGTCIDNVHEDGVNSVSFAPYGISGFSTDEMAAKVICKKFVTCGNDKKVKIWSYSDSNGKWELEHTLEGHDDFVRDVAWAPFGVNGIATIASCGQDNRIILWTCNYGNNETKWKKHVLDTLDEYATTLSFNTVGDVLCASAGDSTIKLYKHIIDEWIELKSPKKEHNKSSTKLKS